VRQSVKWLVAAALCLGAIPALAQVSYSGGTYTKPPLGIEQYIKQSPTTGSTMAFAPGVQQMQIGGASTIGALTIDLTVLPYDGQIDCFYTKPIVTALTLTAAGTQTLNDAVTAATATTRYCYIYSNSNTSWDRIQ